MATRKAKKWLGVAMRSVTTAILVLLGSLVVLILLMALGPVRERLLDAALGAARARLPGTLEVGSSAWPEIGRLALQRIVWTAGPDTLLRADSLAVTIDVSELRRRDVRLAALHAVASVVDVPRLAAAFRRPHGEPAPQARAPEPPFFPRPGAIPGLPSVAVEDLDLRIGRLAASPATTLHDVAVRAACDLTPARGPRLRIVAATAHDGDGRWSVDVADLDIDGERGKLGGEVAARLDSLGTLRAVLRTAADGELQARASLGPRDADDARRIVAQLTGRPDRRGLELQSLAYDLALSIPATAELAQWPAPLRRAGRLPQLGPLHVDATGVLTLRPRFAVVVQAAATPQDWLAALGGRFAYRDGSVQVDSLSVGLPGLRATLRGHRSADRVEAAAGVEIEDGRWLAIFGPRATIPESLVATVQCTVRGARRDPSLRLRLEAAARWAGSVFDPCTLAADYPHGLRSPGTVQLVVGTHGLVFAGAARVAIASPVHAELEPIEVRLPGRDAVDRAPATRRPPEPARVDFDPRTGDLRVDDLRIAGALGNATLRADLQRLQGSFGVGWEWPQAPRALAKLLRLQTAAWDSVGARWETDAPFGIRLSGTREAAAGGTQTRVTGRVHLPGPRTLAPLFGSPARLAAFGSLDADVSLQLAESSATRRWSGEVDLTPTTWLRGSNVRVHGDARSVAIDELQLGLADLSLMLSATRRDSVVDARAHVLLAGGALLRDFAALGDADTVRVEVRGMVQGTIDDPRVELELDAGGRYRGWNAPVVAGRVRRDAGRWSARLDVPGGVSGPLPLLELDSLELAFDSAQRGRDPFPGRVDLAAHGPRFALATRGAVTRQPGWEVRGDTLATVLRDKDLRSLQPFVIGARDGSVRFEGLALAGSLGRVEAAGSIGGRSVDLDAEIALELGGFAFVPSLPPGVWPQRVDLHLRATGPRAFELRGAIEDFALGSRPSLRVRIEARADSSRLATQVEIVDGTSTVLQARADLSDPWNVPNAMAPRTFEASAELSGFPVPWELLGRAGTSMPASTLDAHLSASGSADQPRADLGADIRIPLGNGRPAEIVAALALGSQPSPMPATPETRGLDLGRWDEIRSQLDGYGLTAIVGLERAGKKELDAAGGIPLRIAAGRGVQVDAERALRLEVEIPGLELADWSELLPAGAALDGRMTGSLEVRGLVTDPQLAGSLSVPRLDLATRDGSRASGQGSLSVAGTGRRPVVRGTMTATSALVPIPEEPRKLLPEEGPSLLRQAAGSAADSTRTGAGATPVAPVQPSRPHAATMQPDLEVELVVPSGCWVKGRNLSVELSGKLRLRQKGSEPTILGELEARQGTLVFLGRTFQLDRGLVQFFGEDETNPTLDVRLSTKISSTTVRILVAGTAKEPRVELVSEPEMSQSDIMSLLVFGRSKEDLNGDELQLVAQRSAAIAATWGAAELQGLGGSLGVDMLRLQPGATPTGESSVVVGKYLSERALLKYEQALDSTTGFFVALEYTLTRNLSVQTLAGTWQSGAELNWSKDY